MGPRRRQAETRSKTLHARVTPTQWKALQRIAREDGATESEVIRRLVAAEIRKRKR